MSELTTHYDHLIKEGQLKNDKRQRALLSLLEKLRGQLLKRRGSLWRRLFGKNHIKGLYFFGSVGTGKTFLMDLFFDSLPFKEKKRLHFHQFMRRIQTQLTALQGQESPLEIVAKKWAKETTVLCFDEFYVSDIADAMILERLFNALFREGVILVATSNISPDNLYLDGLHRRRFLPAIELIKKQCAVFHLDSQNDYRREFFDKEGVYFYPTNRRNKQKMIQWFDLYSKGTVHDKILIDIESRTIETIKMSDSVIWFHFDKLCAPPRSYVDYLALSKQFKTVLVSGVPVISASDVASITYLIHLVDVFYDAHIRLVIMAEAPAELLYVKGKKHFEFQRCLSRLEEMRSKEYVEYSVGEC